MCVVLVQLLEQVVDLIYAEVDDALNCFFGLAGCSDLAQCLYVVVACGCNCDDQLDDLAIAPVDSVGIGHDRKTGVLDLADDALNAVRDCQVVADSCVEDVFLRDHAVNILLGYIAAVHKELTDRTDRVVLRNGLVVQNDVLFMKLLIVTILALGADFLARSTRSWWQTTN